EDQHLRLAYDGRNLEIMVTGHPHENYKQLFGRIVAIVAWRTNVHFVSLGEATWQVKERGLQADLSYCFDPAKIQVARDALKRKSLNQGDYPSPDLAIEIDLSPPQTDRSATYAELGVSEIWRFVKGQKVVIEQLQPDGSYLPAESSRFLPLRAADI